MKKLNINAIRIDGGTQSRVEINMEAVSEYAEAIKAGVEFPAVVVFHDGADYWLADGFHRYHAHKNAGKASIEAEVKTGTVRDAILYSLGANDSHGLRRTNADKRKAVNALLADAEWAKWPETKMADLCRVSRTLIRAVLEESHLAEKQDAKRTVERNGKTYQQDTSNIGKKAAKEPKRTLNQPEELPANDDQLIEAQHAINDLAAENERLSDRLAVEAMDASEEEKNAATQTIAELRERVRLLEIEVSALKSSRDTYMRESQERLKQINYWRKQAEKAAA